MNVIIDYNVGNLHNLKNALDYSGIKSKLISLADDVKGSIVAYVVKNCTDEEIKNLEDNLSGIGSVIDQDLQNITDPATEFTISGTQDHYTKYN